MFGRDYTRAMQSCQAGDGRIRIELASSDAAAVGAPKTLSILSHSAADLWLSPQEACRRLGVHNNTLRRWAARGWIASSRTAGGHRRFRLADLEANAERLALAKRPGEAERPGPPDRLSAVQRASLRAMGQRLSTLVQRFLAREDTDLRLLADARQIGRAYASRAISAGMPLSEAIAAFLYYRSHLVGFLQAEPDALAERYMRYDEVVGAVLIGLAQGYETCFLPSRTGSALATDLPIDDAEPIGPLPHSNRR